MDPLRVYGVHWGALNGSLAELWCRTVCIRVELVGTLVALTIKTSLNAKTLPPIYFPSRNALIDAVVLFKEPSLVKRLI